MTDLTHLQRRTLARMAEENVGAILVGTRCGIIHGGRPDAFAFPDDVRRGSATMSGDEIARAVIVSLDRPHA